MDEINQMDLQLEQVGNAWEGASFTYRQTRRS